MVHRLVSVLLIVFVLLVGEARAASVIVKLEQNASILAAATSLSGTVVDSIPGANIYLLNLPDSSLNLLFSSFLTRLAKIEWWEINSGVIQTPYAQLGIVQVGGSTAADWYKYQPAMTLIRAAEANVYSTGRGVVIADINSQVDYSHSALIGHLTSGYDFVQTRPPGSAALDQSSASFLEQSSASFLDQSSASFLDQSSASFLDESNISLLSGGQNPAYSHGTLTAGIIAAIAPDSMIMPLRAFNERGAADLFILAKAIRYAVDNGAQVINMSFGIVDKSGVLKSSIDYANARNVITVASAGNDNTANIQYPAAYPGVLTAAATDLTDAKAGFSNYGSYIFAAAPGVNIVSAYPGQLYAVVSGTSFSAPALAATAGLLRSLRPTAVSDAIAAGAENIDSRNPAYRSQLGYGRIDALRSVK